MNSKVSIERKLTAWEAENEGQTREWCKVVISVIECEHLDPVIQRLQGKDAAEVSFKDVIDGYNKIKEDYFSSTRGARNVISTVFFEFHQVRQYAFCVSFIYRIFLERDF